MMILEKPEKYNMYITFFFSFKRCLKWCERRRYRECLYIYFILCRLAIIKMNVESRIINTISTTRSFPAFVSFLLRLIHVHLNFVLYEPIKSDVAHPLYNKLEHSQPQLLFSCFPLFAKTGNFMCEFRDHERSVSRK